MLRPWILLLAAACAAGCSFNRSDSGAEVCNDFVDNDFDGRIDCEDTECAAQCPTAADRDSPIFSATCRQDWPLAAETDNGTNLGYCEGWPVGSGSDCVAGVQVQVPGAGSDCQTVGTEICEQTIFVNTVYVDTNAEAGGNGSPMRPFNTLTEALASDANLDTVVFRGREEDVVTIQQSLVILGACVEESALAGGVVVQGADADVRFQNLTVGAPMEDSLNIEAGAAVELENCALEGGVSVTGTGTAVVDGVETLVPSEAQIEASVVRGAIRVGNRALLEIDGTTIGGGNPLLPCVAVTGDQTTLVVRGAIFQSCRGGGLAVRGTPARVQLDTVFFDVPSSVSIDVDCNSTGTCLEVDGLVVNGNSTSVGPIVRISSGLTLLDQVVLTGSGPAVESLGGTLSMNDVAIFAVVGEEGSGDPSGTGILVNGGAVEAGRLDIETVGVVGIDVVSGRFFGEDVSFFERPPNQDSESTPDPTVGAIRAAAGTSLGLERFVDSNVGPCAFTLDRDVTLSLESGVLQGVTAAFCLPALDTYSTETLANQITYQNVMETRRIRAAE